MDIVTFKAFFMWCTIINMGMLILSSLVCIYLREFSFQMNHKYFGIPREAFNVGICAFIAVFKMTVIVFNLVPYVALVILG